MNNNGTKKPGRINMNRRKLQPRLRMIANCDSEVNARRAEHSGNTVVTSQELLDKAVVRAEDACALAASDLNLEAPIPNPPSLEAVPTDVLVNVFIETNDLADERNFQKTIESAATADPEDATRKKVGVPARRGNIATATVRLSQLQELVNLPGVTFVEPGQALATPTPIVSSDINVHPSLSPRAFGDSAEHKNGKGVLIGIIDVQGFDFAHEDFLKDGSTRFVRIWDQGGAHRPSPHDRAEGDEKTLVAKHFDYGSEIRQEDMNTAIRMSEEIGAPPT